MVYESRATVGFIKNRGHIGMTVYIGFFDIGRIQHGETLVVSGAVGAVG